MSEPAFRYSFYVLAALFTLRSFLAGASQLPDSGGAALATGAVLFLSFVFWARSQLPRGDHPLIRREAGLWLVVLAPITVLYYLIASRHSDGLRGFELKDTDGYVLFFGRPHI